MTSVHPSSTRPACVVVGAGVLGVISAYRLAQAGVEVTLVDSGDVGGGTTGASFAHVNASYAGYWSYVELRRAGVHGFARMRQELDGAPWWHETGYLCVLRPTGSFTDLDAHVDRLRAMEYPVDRLDGPDDRLADLEPALTIREVGRALRFPAEGYVDLPKMVADLTHRLRGLGGDVRTGDGVVAVLTDGASPNGTPKVTGVRLRSGTTIECGRLLVCAGRWTDDVLSLAGLKTHLVAHDTAAGTPVPGLLVITDSVPGSVSKVVSIDDINYRPAGDGHTMLWSGLVDKELRANGGLEADRDIVQVLADGLLRAASRYVPALAAAHVDQAIVTARSMPADGLPIVGPLTQVDGAYVVLAHAAATLAPVLGDIVAAEIAHGAVDPRLDMFRPTRFDSSVAGHPAGAGTWPDPERREAHDLAAHS